MDEDNGIKKRDTSPLNDEKQTMQRRQELIDRIINRKMTKPGQALGEKPREAAVSDNYATPAKAVGHDYQQNSLQEGQPMKNQRIYNSVKNVKSAHGGKAYGLNDVSIKEELEYNDTEDGPLDQQSNQFRQYDLKSGRHSQHDVIGTGLASDNGGTYEKKDDDYVAAQLS